MKTTAIVFEQPLRFALRSVEMEDARADDVVVDVAWTGISTGTERLLWSGRMPSFPGMGYPLIPGYESVGRIANAGPAGRARVGDLVFVPGASCYKDVKPLFGGAASSVVVPSSRAVSIPERLQERGILLALAATAFHAVQGPEGRLPELIVGHGALGRLMARITVAAGGAPVVWETDPVRRDGACGYPVVEPDADSRKQYGSICDASGADDLLDQLIGRLAPGGEIVLAGFYVKPLSFAFPPAFMREARIRIAAQWRPEDLAGVLAWVEADRLSLDGIITHRVAATDAADAYDTAFAEPCCLKMVLNWAELAQPARATSRPAPDIRSA